MNKPSASAVTDYFERFLRPRIGRPMLPGLETLSVTFRMATTDDGGEGWRIEVREGRLEAIEPDSTADCECEYRLSTEDFSRIVAARLNPKIAFFTGRVKIQGNVLTGLKVSTLMEEFFRRNPYPGDTA